VFIVPSAYSQNTGGVFGPEVTPNSRALEWRTSVAPGSDGRSDRVASRLHYQQTVTDDLRLRAVLQGADEPASTSDFDFDFLQLEAQWQFLEDEEDGWDSALRLDLQLAEGRADLLGLNGRKWSYEASLLFGVTNATADTDFRLFIVRSF